MCDDFFDDDFTWEDGVVIGSALDYLVDQEDEDEKRRRKLEDDAEYDPIFNPKDNEPYP